MNFGTWFEEKAVLLADKPALYFEDKVISYKQLDLFINKVGNFMSSLGLSKGDKCALLLRNCPEYLYAWFGLAKIGCVAACVNISLRGDSLKYLIAHSDSKTIILNSDLCEHFEEIENSLPKLEHVIWLPETPPHRKHDYSFNNILSDASDASPLNGDIIKGDPMALVHTGGTTGLPKWCTLSHNHYIENAELYAEFFGLSPSDRLFNPLPLFHTNPQVIFVMNGLAANASLILTDRFSASAFWDQVRKYKATCLILHIGAVDILKQRPVAPGETDHNVRIGFRIDAAFMKRFNIPTAIVGYGCTELGMVTMNRYRMPLTKEAEELPYLSTICGKPLGHKEIRIADDNDEILPVGEVGEILIRPQKPYVVFNGYYNDAVSTFEKSRGFWWHTGDAGFVDHQGRLHYVQRKGDSIRVRGEWVFIAEVENIIKSHPAVNDCVVVGVPGDVGGEEIKAVIELKSGTSVKPEEILAHCTGKIAYFMIPRYIEFIAELPKTVSTGRIRKAELKKNGVLNAWDREAAGYKINK